MFDKEIQLKFECEVACDVASLYSFHTDTNNLPRITPPWIKTEIISLELPLHEGSEIELDITRFAMTQRWKMRIDTLQSPDLVCDRALQSPFSSFVHFHRFRAISETKSMMTDEIRLSLPYYPFSLLIMPFIKHDIAKMFLYRHQKTKKLLEKKNV